MVKFIKRIFDYIVMKLNFLKNKNCSFSLLNNKGYGLIGYDDKIDNGFSIRFSKTEYTKFENFHTVFVYRNEIYQKTGIFLDIFVEKKE